MRRQPTDRSAGRPEGGRRLTRQHTDRSAGPEGGRRITRQHTDRWGGGAPETPS